MLVLGVKLLGAPLLIGGASLVGRRWGQSVAGLLGGLPVVTGPIVIALWLQHGPQFAADASLALPAGLLAVSAHMLAMGWLATRFAWPICVLGGWLAYFAIALTVSPLPVPPVAKGIAALFCLLGVNRCLPRLRGEPPRGHLPKVELAARMLAALGLVVALTALSARLGPALTGILATFPVAGTVMPAFTLATTGRDALWAMMRGFTVGLIGLGVYFLVLSPLILPLSWWALAPALAASVASASTLSVLMRRRA